MDHQDASISSPEVHEYGFLCSFDGNGAIYNRDNKMLWQFKTVYLNNRHIFPFSFFQLLPDFVLYDGTGKAVLTIKCERRYPLTKFLIIEKNLTIGTIQQQSILKNKYIIDFHGGNTWTFRLPLFAVLYKADSESGAQVLVRLVRHDTWHLKVPIESDDWHLLAALAIIHRERQHA